MGLCSRSTAAALAATALLVSLSGCGWGGFTFTSNTPAISIMADYTTPAISVTVGPQNDTPFDVTVTATPPAGFTCNPTCTITTRHLATFRFDTDTTIPHGIYNIAFQAVGGGFTRNTSTQVTVAAWNGITPPPDYDFSVSPASMTYTCCVKSPSYGTILYQLGATRYNHYTGPIFVTLQAAEGFTCGGVPCNTPMTMTGPTLAVPFGVFIYPTGAPPQLGINTFTATAPPGVVRTATATVIINPMPPPPPGPSPPGGTG